MWTLRWTSVLHLNLQTLRLHSTMILTVAAQCPLILRNVAYCKIIFFSYTQYMKQMLFLITDLPAEFFFLFFSCIKKISSSHLMFSIVLWEFVDSVLSFVVINSVILSLRVDKPIHLIQGLKQTNISTDLATVPFSWLCFWCLSCSASQTEQVFNLQTQNQF